MRKKWAEGTVLYTRDGAEYKITASNEAGGTAIIYYAEKAGSGIRAVLKEFYPQEWERRKGVPVERAYVDSPDEDPDLLSCYKKLAKQAAREMKISQEVARETVHVWPVRGMLEVQSIREPDGTVWQAEGALPCCILEMDNLNHKDGLWLQDILREAGKEKSKETPLGNLQPNSKPVLAVPPLQVTLMLVWRLLILLAKIHAAGYLHGDINLGNVFLAMDDKGANVLNAMLIDFGSARALVDGETAPLGKESVMATPGFAAPELEGGGEQRLTPKADVYAVGKLMHCLLDQNILEALRKGWYSDLEEDLKAPTLNASGINDPQLTPAVQKSLDQILSGAAEIKPEKRSSVQEMMEQIMQLYRKIEPPAWQMSLGLLQLNGDEVLGRDKDIKEIEAKLWAEGKLVLHGFSGIGKTKLVTLLGHKWQRNYPCSQVYYAFYPGSMTGLAVDTLARNMSTVAFTEQKDGKDVPRPVAGIIDDMFRELNAHMHENDLLIIDNVDDDTQEYWDSVVHEETVQGQTDLFTRLCQLNCKVLFVTRLDVSNVTGIVPFEVDRLELEPLRAILRENSKDVNGHSDAQKRSDEELDRLIALVDRHTMTVDMIARTMRESRLTVPEIYKELSCDGYGSGAFVEISGQKDTDYSKNRIEGHLIRLFRLANFNEREQDMLRYAQLIGENSGMYETLFLSCCPHESKDENTKNLEALNHLLRLGYVQQKTEENSKKIILNLHTLVRVVARKELPIEIQQIDSFFSAMPISYHISCKECREKLPVQVRIFIAESYAQARTMVDRESFLFGYWSSCASAWFNNAQSHQTSSNSLQTIECFLDGLSIYIALKTGLLSLAGVPDIQKKVLCFYWNLWNTLGYMTPGIVRMNCGTTEQAQRYWTFCLEEPNRRLEYPALFHEYQKCYDLCEEFRHKFLAGFRPNNYWDYQTYRNIASYKDRIQVGQNLLKHFKKETFKDYKDYLGICTLLTDEAYWHFCFSGSDAFTSDILPSLEQQESLAARTCLEFLRQQNQIDYEQAIQLCKKQIEHFDLLNDKEEISYYQKELLKLRKEYLQFLSTQEVRDVIRQVTCCDQIAEQYLHEFSGEGRSDYYRKMALNIRLDFSEHPEKYLSVQSPLDELRIYNEIIHNRTIKGMLQLPAEKNRVHNLCNKILNIGQANEKDISTGKSSDDCAHGQWPMLDYHEKAEFYSIMQKAACQLKQYELAQKYAKLSQETLHGENISLWWLRNEPRPSPNPLKHFSRIAYEAEALVCDLKNGEMTDEKDRYYRQVIFGKAKTDDVCDVDAATMMECKYQDDLLKIINAYEEMGDYRRQLVWLEQIIFLHSSGLWRQNDHFADPMVPLMWYRTIDGKLDDQLYPSHYFMESYYEKAIRTAQHIHDHQKALKLVEELFEILLQDTLSLYQNKPFSHASDLLAWLRACSLYAYFCCMQKRYVRAGNSLIMADESLNTFLAGEQAKCPNMCETELKRVVFAAQGDDVFHFIEEQLRSLEKLLPAHHPILYMQRDLMIHICDNEKVSMQLAELNNQEKLLAVSLDWNSWWEPDT